MYFIFVIGIALYNVLSVISISYSLGPPAIHQRQQVAYMLAYIMTGHGVCIIIAFVGS